MPSSSSLLRRRSTMDSATAVQRLPDDQQRRTLGLPTDLSCSAPSEEVALNATSHGYNVTVEFEYELVVSNPNEPVVEVTSQDIPFLEYAVLQLMAQAIHLRPCDLSSQNLASSSNATVTDLSSFKPDSLDDSVPSCEFLSALDTSWICLPMKGGMTATYSGTREDRDAVVGYLLTNIENVVNNAGKTIGRVGDAYFVESRVHPASAPKTVASSDSGSDSVVALASSLAGAAVVTILVFYFVAARRRRKANKNPPTQGLTIGTKEAVFVDRDPVLNSVPTAVTTSTANTVSKSEELLQDHGDLEAPSSGDTAQVTIDSPSSTDAVAAPISLMTGRTASTANMEDSDSDNENTPADQYEEELKRISNVPPKDDEFKNVGTSGTGEVGPTVMVDISKPPKPPTVPSSKPPVPVPVLKPLKKRRRRKKKKKSSTAQRSRDVVAGMETIAEGIEEETKSGNEDDDSEYSWYSTSDSEPGSRDPSPARSREESPCRSQSGSQAESPPRAIVAEKNEGTEKPQLPPRWV